MIWILAVVVVGLVTVLAELLLSYQKRANDLRVKQEPLRRRIREHNQAMQEAVSGVQGAASAQVVELTAALTELAGRGEALLNELGGLERQVFGDGYNPNAPRADDLIEEDEPEAGRVSDDDPGEKLVAARDYHRREVEGHRLSMQRDVEVVRRTLNLLETKLRRAAPAKGAD